MSKPHWIAFTAAGCDADNNKTLYLVSKHQIGIMESEKDEVNTQAHRDTAKSSQK